MAVAGSAVGLGNFLRFPVQAMNNGGGAFLLPYLLSFLLLGIPLLWVEWAMGRNGGKHGKHSPAFVFHVHAPHQKRWAFAGALGIFINLVVAAYYCYIESWTLLYSWLCLKGHFAGKTITETAAEFDAYTDSATATPWLAIGLFLVTVLLNTTILAQGISKGIERVSLIGMPLLLLLAIFLAYQGVTMEAGVAGAKYSGSVGLNFLWEPRPAALLDPNVWLAAAGQIFFTTAVGMGIIHSYASYMRPNDDITLSAMTGGWLNEFVEVVLGSSILIPIAVSYLGLELVQQYTQTGGMGLAFRTMPHLFTQWGPIAGAFAGFSFFFLLFFAGITSSLAMGTPWMALLVDEFDWSRTKAAISFGLLVVLLGLPCILFFSQGWLDEFDYWAGTISLVVFGLAETILFAWVRGMPAAWADINHGAELKPWAIYKPVIKYVMPALLISFLLGSTLAPIGGDWSAAIISLLHGNGWPFSSGSIVGKLFFIGTGNGANMDIAIVARLVLIAVLASVWYLVYLALRKQEKSLPNS